MEGKVQSAKRELLAVRSEERTEQHRRTLAESICDKVIEQEKAAGFVSEDLEEIVRLGTEDDEFFRSCGAELWEICIVLEALSPCDNVRRLTELVINHCPPRELLLMWKVSTSALLSYEDPAPGFTACIFQTAESPLLLLDLCKTVTSRGLARLISALQPKDLVPLLKSELVDFLTLLCKEMDEAYKFVRSDDLLQLIQALSTRSEVLCEAHMLHSSLRLTTVLLGLLDSNSHTEHQHKCIELILALRIDLHTLLLTWRKWFTATHTLDAEYRVYSAKGVAALLQLSTVETEFKMLHLPCVFSPLYRLQVYLPVANLVFTIKQEAVVDLLEYALSGFEGTFQSIRTPFLLVPEGKQSTEQFLKEWLDLMGSTQNDIKRKKLIVLFKRFLGFFSDTVLFRQHRLVLIRALVQTYVHDTAIGLVLDLFLFYSKSIPIFQSPKHILQFVKLGLKKSPASDFPNTLQSAAMLYYFHLLKSQKTPSEIGEKQRIIKVRTKLLEPAVEALGKAFEADRERGKLEIVLGSLNRVVEVAREIESK